MKPPPPKLPAAGCVTARAKATAMAASTALPPRFIMSTPTLEAISLVEATMPWRALTGSREAARVLLESKETRRSDATRVKATEAVAIDLKARQSILYFIGRAFDNQTAAECFRLLPQVFKRAHGFAMIHRCASDCAQPAVAQAGMPAKFRVRGFIILQFRHLTQKFSQISRTQSHPPF